MKWKLDQFETFMVIAILVLVFAMSISMIKSAFGENYVYHLTKNESDQVIISELCYNKVAIDECKLLYGGMDTQFGEALK
jgi:hypothetical protein